MSWSLPAGLILVLVACSAEPTPTSTDNASAATTTGATTVESTQAPVASTEANQALLFPDVIGVEVTDNRNGTYRFDVTISSPYDRNDQYADAWRVLGPDGTEYGVRVLTHPHANEQPFTRSLDGVEIPAAVTEVTIEGRDLVNGWGGATMLTPLN
jgi:hypothetical protein